MTSSGVLHVHKNSKSKKYNWSYSNNTTTVSDTTLLSLESKIKSMGLPWVIRGDEVYERVISEEWDDDDFSLMNAVFS